MGLGVLDAKCVPEQLFCAAMSFVENIWWGYDITALDRRKERRVVELFPHHIGPLEINHTTTSFSRSPHKFRNKQKRACSCETTLQQHLSRRAIQLPWYVCWRLDASYQFFPPMLLFRVEIHVRGHPANAPTRLHCS
jgi:hypothetical protein